MIRWKHSIRFKLIFFVFSLSILFVGIAVLVGYFQGRILLRDTIISEHKHIARRISATVSEMITKEIAVIETHSASLFWIPAINEKNQTYLSMSNAAIQAFFIDMDKKWIAAQKDSSFIREYLDTSLSLRLIKLVELDQDIAEIIVTDKWGGLVAASGRTSDFYQADEQWWKKVFEKGKVFIGDIAFDESSQCWAITIAVPIKDTTKETIGICKTVLKVDSFFKPLARVRIENTGRAFLINERGYFLFHENVAPLGKPLFTNKMDFQKLIHEKDYWEIIEKEDKNDKGKRLVVVAPLKNRYLLEEGKRWWILVSQDIKEAFMPFNQLYAQMVTLLVILFIVLLLLGYILSRIFVAPIMKLYEIIKHITQGELDYPIEVKTGDEIEAVSNAFEEMLFKIKEEQQELKAFSELLEQKVEERTKDLENSQKAMFNIMEDVQEEKEKLQKQTVELAKAHKELASFSKGLEEKVQERTRELAILYEISNAIAYTLDYQILFRLIMESLFKIIDYDVCAVLLFDTYTVNIILKPAYFESVGFVEEVKQFLIDSTSVLTGENIRERHVNTFVIPANPDINPGKDRSFDTLRSFFNVPFIVQGKTVGMINVSSCKENAFSETNIKLISTVANQTSNAIERLRMVVSAEKTKMESMVESMTEGIIMIDDRGEIAVCNPRAKELLSFSHSQIVTVKEFTERMNEIGLYNVFLECQNKQKEMYKEIVVSQLPHDMHLRSDMMPVKGMDNQIIGVVVILRDITREKEIDHMKTEFVSTVSHELRTPLSITREGISLMLDRTAGPINEQQARILDMAKNNIDRLAGIINDLLDISKIEAGKVELNLEMTNLTDLIRQVVGNFAIKAREKGLQIQSRLPHHEVYLYIDLAKIIQVFINLINNAIKFTDKGDITISVEDKEEEVECCIQDTGRGISQEDLPKVFGKFQQFGRVAGGGEKGTGLGLSIVKGLIELHHGKIEVKSELNKGTLFTFSLPKLTSEMIFQQYVKNGIRKATEGNVNMSLIIVSFVGFDTLKEKISPLGLEDILKGVEKALKDASRYEKDVIVNVAREKGEVSVILNDCDKEHALRIEGRFSQCLEDYLIKEKLDQNITVQFGTSTYPDDSLEADELIKHAKEMR